MGKIKISSIEEIIKKFNQLRNEVKSRKDAIMFVMYGLFLGILGNFLITIINKDVLPQLSEKTTVVIKIIALLLTILFTILMYNEFRKCFIQEKEMDGIVNKLKQEIFSISIHNQRKSKKRKSKI